jgi:hypothetical protein
LPTPKGESALNSVWPAAWPDNCVFSRSEQKTEQTETATPRRTDQAWSAVGDRRPGANYVPAVVIATQDAGRRVGLLVALREAAFMDLRLHGKVALVTGSGRGIGLATAKAFAAEGCRVMLSARSAERLREMEEALRETGAEVAAHAADVGSPDPTAQPA